jgi:hypothetical protein
MRKRRHSEHVGCFLCAALLVSEQPSNLERQSFVASLPLYLPDSVYQCLLENLKYERTIETSSLPKEASNCETENTDRTTEGGDGCIKCIQYRASDPMSSQVTFNLLD